MASRNSTGQGAGRGDSSGRPDPYELCIVGAGIAGLNALAVAARYLSATDRVLLVEARPRVGGMWVDTYDFVRLHQPHAIFTAGDIPWTLGAKPSHLASKCEVLEHLQHCLDHTARALDLDARFGCSYVSHEETDLDIDVTLQSADGQRVVIRTKRLIKAFGHRVVPNEPFALSSPHPRSVTPETLDLDELAADDAPVWIAGGGKTAMDAAYQLITALPGREINMAVGPGTIFARRETFFPSGAKRWWSGKPVNTMLRELGRRYDGTNEHDVGQWFLGAYGISPVGDAEHFFSAYLSQAEGEVIRSGVRRVEREYVTDVVDRDGGTHLAFRSGGSTSVRPDSWIVNCTGSLLRTEHPYEPFVSASGRTLSIQMRSSATGPFSSFAGYYLTHLLFLGRLGRIGLYELDVEDLQRKASSAVLYASVSLVLHNLSLLAVAVPKKVLLDCGLDFDRWYPMPRRMAGTADFLRTRTRDLDHHRRTLATVHERFGVRCGPLES